MKSYKISIKTREDIRVLNTYAPNNSTSKYVKQKPIELQQEIH